MDIAAAASRGARRTPSASAQPAIEAQGLAKRFGSTQALAGVDLTVARGAVYGRLVPADLSFLDEPTTGLDPVSRAQVWDIIRAVVADGATVLLTTQYLDEADQLADRIAVIDNGTIIAEGTTSELKAATGSGTVHI